ncbi:MAG: hypothetical protein ABEH81_03490 [Halopenitus sp.]
MTEINTIVETLTSNRDNDVPDNFEMCLKAADENGLLYPFCKQIGFDKIPHDYQQRIKSQKRNIETLRETIRRINQISELADVNYALIKDANSIEHVPRDVDILVHPNNKDTFIQAAAELGFDCDQSGDIETTLTGEDVYPVDLYTNIIYFCVEFLTPEYLLSSQANREAFGVEYIGLSSEAALLVTLVHGVFGHRRFTLLDYLHMQNLVSDGVDFDTCREVATKFGWGDTFNKFLETLNQMETAIECPQSSIQFPYVLPYSQMMDNVKSISGFELTPRRHAAITFSIVLDGIKIRVENSMLYEPIQRCEPLRKFLLAIAYHSRRGRGDQYS